MAKKLSSKANYVSKWNIKSITTKNGKKTTEIDGKNLFDGVYVKKGVKFEDGGNMKEFLTYDEINGLKIGQWECYVVNIDIQGGPVIWENPKGLYIFYAEPGFDGEKILHFQVEMVDNEEEDSNTIVFKSSNALASFNKRNYLSEVKKVIDIIERKKDGVLTTQDFKKDFIGARYEKYAKGGVAGRTSIEIDIFIDGASGKEEIKKTWKKYGITGVFKKVDEQQDYAVITGTKENLKKYLLSEEYGMEEADLKAIFPEIYRTGGVLKSKEYIVVCKDIKTGEEEEFEVMAESKFDAKERAKDMCEFSNPKVTSIELFRTGGVAGSKHVDVTKGYRLPHGYKAVKGEDRNRNYSKGKPKVKVDAGWRLPKGYEVVDGAYNMKYEDGGMVEAKISREFSNLQNGVKASYEKLFTEIVDSLESDFDVNRNVAFNKVFNVSSWDKTKKFLNEGYAPNQVAQMFYKGEFGKMKYENGGMMGDNMNDCYCYEIGGL